MGRRDGETGDQRRRRRRRRSSASYSYRGGSRCSRRARCRCGRRASSPTAPPGETAAPSSSSSFSPLRPGGQVRPGTSRPASSSSSFWPASGGPGEIFSVPQLASRVRCTQSHHMEAEAGSLTAVTRVRRRGEARMSWSGPVVTGESSTPPAGAQARTEGADLWWLGFPSSGSDSGLVFNLSGPRSRHVRGCACTALQCDRSAVCSARD